MEKYCERVIFGEKIAPRERYEPLVVKKDDLWPLKSSGAVRIVLPVLALGHQEC
jgi:hypothetical protein